MNSPVDVDVLVKFALRLSFIFALIFVFALLTPRIAQLIEGWIAKYRKHHEDDAEETYGLRSIYELPPKRKPADTLEEYDLDAEDEELDEEDYSLDDEEPEVPVPLPPRQPELPAPKPPKLPEPPAAQEPEPPVYLFSFHRLGEKPYDLTLWNVKYKRAVPIDIGIQDFSAIAFGSPLHSASFIHPPLPPVPEDEDEDAEAFIGNPLIPCDTEGDSFFEDEDGETSGSGDDLPWFMR